MADIYVEDLEEVTSSSLTGEEQFVMFDSESGIRVSLDDVATYIIAKLSESEEE